MTMKTEMEWPADKRHSIKLVTMIMQPSLQKYEIGLSTGLNLKLQTIWTPRDYTTTISIYAVLNEILSLITQFFVTNIIFYTTAIRKHFIELDYAACCSYNGVQPFWRSACNDEYWIRVHQTGRKKIITVLYQLNTHCIVAKIITGQITHITVVGLS